MQSHEPFALATPATQPAIMVDQSHDAEVIREFTAEDLSFDGAVSEQAVKRIKNNLINKRLPQWTDALACIEKAKTPEDVNKQISAAMPVLKATALRKLAQLDSIEQNGKQLREGSREKAYIVKWGKVREYVGDAGKENRDKLASWLINALDDGKTAAAICSLFDDDKAQ